MDNPLTGKMMPYLYEVEIYQGKNIITSITVKSTNEEQAIVQAVKALKTKVRRI